MKATLRAAGIGMLSGALVFVGLLLSALATELIGVHAIFGAFLFGAVIPHDSSVARELGRKLEDFVTVLLLRRWRLARDLADAGNRVVLLDLPGHGFSDKPRDPAAYRLDAQELAEKFASTLIARPGRKQGPAVERCGRGRKWSGRHPPG